jgi:hypothetical protein
VRCCSMSWWICGRERREERRVVRKAILLRSLDFMLWCTERRSIIKIGEVREGRERRDNRRGVVVGERRVVMV